MVDRLLDKGGVVQSWHFEENMEDCVVLRGSYEFVMVSGGNS